MVCGSTAFILKPSTIRAVLSSAANHRLASMRSILHMQSYHHHSHIRAPVSLLPPPVNPTQKGPGSQRLLLSANRPYTQNTTNSMNRLGFSISVAAGAAVLASSVGVALALFTPDSHQIECSPLFQGVPVAATFLIHQAIPVVTEALPGLEVSAVFSPELGGHMYEETGGILGVYRTGAVVELPMFERTTPEEAQRLGVAGIFKEAVGVLRATGECKYGCATVRLLTLTLYALNEDGQLDRENPVWTWAAKKHKI
ncbi:hypothetical protein BASA50_005133 [Batrachochytrium salamandrivorans]|uniref:Uncharacterized protein n=1 Tax=Batrachochytrium salamandrivorans TaxID=1357716 RepID=A0ABQ8FDI6_9FUNG|nr:hypothetical protein BASA62_002778 [Batrachochytrium salamandrivorans]KAH6581472.1 hypothetical protein BASA61_009053 [Batrachochytrium salamandrivorans]KAH6596427.1 hypothetical protein BASA50_005133 [Batrachochytrium salamandrivorans]